MIMSMKKNARVEARYDVVFVLPMDQADFMPIVSCLHSRLSALSCVFLIWLLLLAFNDLPPKLRSHVLIVYLSRILIETLHIDNFLISLEIDNNIKGYHRL